jgi:hypothetical protein
MLIFSLALEVAELLAFCNFSQNKTFKTYHAATWQQKLAADSPQFNKLHNINGDINEVLTPGKMNLKGGKFKSRLTFLLVDVNLGTASDLKMTGGDCLITAWKRSCSTNSTAKL